jgi:hypothetical protein
MAERAMLMMRGRASHRAERRQWLVGRAVAAILPRRHCVAAGCGLWLSVHTVHPGDLLRLHPGKQPAKTLGGPARQRSGSLPHLRCGPARKGAQRMSAFIRESRATSAASPPAAPASSYGTASAWFCGSCPESPRIEREPPSLRPDVTWVNLVTRRLSMNAEPRSAAKTEIQHG